MLGTRTVYGGPITELEVPWRVSLWCWYDRATRIECSTIPTCLLGIAATTTCLTGRISGQPLICWRKRSPSSLGRRGRARWRSAVGWAWRAWRECAGLHVTFSDYDDAPLDFVRRSAAPMESIRDRSRPAGLIGATFRPSSFP